MSERKKLNNTLAMDMSKLQPQARDAEEAIIGAVMSVKGAYDRVVGIIRTPEVFYVDSHQLIWKSIVDLYDRGEGVDFITVTAELKKQGNLEQVGGAYLLTQLTNKSGGDHHLEYHAKIVFQQYMKRRLISAAGEVAEESFEETSDSFELLSKAHGLIEGIIQDIPVIGSKSVKTEYEEVIEEIRDLINGVKAKAYLSTTYNDLDNVLVGLFKKDLIIIGGRPGMGKTSFVMSLMLRVAKLGSACGIFSLEMSQNELVKRLVGQDVGISQVRLSKGKVSIEDLKKMEESTVPELPLFIDERAGLDIAVIRATARRWKQDHKIKLLCIDYVQLIRCESKKVKSKYDEITEVSRQLKEMAKELDIPVIALAQLSREVEKRADKRPQLSDLKESGNLEQDADIVGFLLRKEYYEIKEKNGERAGINECLFIIAKHRRGALSDVILRFWKETMKFDNLEGGQQEILALSEVEEDGALEEELPF